MACVLAVAMTLVAMRQAASQPPGGVQPLKARGDAVGSRLAAHRQETHPAVEAPRRRPPRVVGRDDDDDALDARLGKQGIDTAMQHVIATEVKVLLGQGCTETSAATRRRDHRQIALTHRPNGAAPPIRR